MRALALVVRSITSFSTWIGSPGSILEPRTTFNSPSFGGANNYFLHGLASRTEQQHYIQALSQQGAKIVRLWVQGTGGTCEKGSHVRDINELEPHALGTFDPTVLDAIDDVLLSLSKVGMKAIISPHDAGKLSLSGTGNGTNSTQGPNGRDVYEKWQTDDFYTNDEAIAAYDRRLTYILNYTSPNFGRKWAQMSNVIAAFDIQNEPFLESTPLLDRLDPKNWLCGRARTIKDLTGSSGPWVATGAVGGSCVHNNSRDAKSPNFFPYNFFPPALNCDAIDVITVHGFSGEWASETCTPSYLNGAAKQKYMMIEEFGLGRNGSSSFDKQSRLFNDAGIPWLYWQMVPGFDQDQGSSCHGMCCTDTNNQTEAISNGWDGFEMSIEDKTKGNVKTANAIAAQECAKRDWTKTPFLSLP